MAVIRCFIAQGRLTDKTLRRAFGARARDVLAGKRELTPDMIWQLHMAVGIPVALPAPPPGMAATAPRPRRSRSS